jgi:adenosylmethionine-8-amino-7-oxononanoate aminotransferase
VDRPQSPRGRPKEKRPDAGAQLFSGGDGSCIAFPPLTSIEDHPLKGPLIVSDSRGVRIKSQHHRDLIDCASELWCINAGYGRTELANAAAEAIANLSYDHLLRANDILFIADEVITGFGRTGSWFATELLVKA